MACGRHDGPACPARWHRRFAGPGMSGRRLKGTPARTMNAIARARNGMRSDSETYTGYWAGEVFRENMFIVVEDMIMRKWCVDGLLVVLDPAAEVEMGEYTDRSS